MKQRVEIRPCHQCGTPHPMRHRGGKKWGKFCSIKCANLARGINPITTRYRKGEHRRVLEQKLGRPLMANEVAHHRNGIKTDNRPENLEPMTNSEHARMHMLGNTNAMKHGLYAGRTR